MQNVLVTGAAGFIGSRLVEALQTNGGQVEGLGTSRRDSELDCFHECNITSSINSEFFRRSSVVYHLAGKVHALSETRQDDAEYSRVNTEGTRNVLEAAQKAGVRRFVLFSTVKAMSRDEARKRPKERVQNSKVGRHSLQRIWTEGDSIEPDTPYGKSKLEAERLVLHGGFVPEPVVLRLCMVYGAGAKGNMQRMLVAVNGNRFPPLPEVGNRRSMVHVRDVVQAALLAAERPEAVGQVFVVSDGRYYSTRQIYELMCIALGRACPRWTVPLWTLRGLGRLGDWIGRARGRRFLFDSDALEKLIGSSCFSSAKIQSLLGFRPEWDLQKALPEMLAEITGNTRVS